MWSICRVDEGPCYGKIPAPLFLFEVQAAHRKADLDMAKARESGFVGPDDELVVIGPDGKPRK